MKVLYLLRHAKSSWDQPGVSDKDRVLSPRGIRACTLLADYFRAREIVPAAIWCSTARRTQETLQRIAGRAGWPTAAMPVTMADGLYLASAEEIVAHVHLTGDTAGTVLVIGHNPGIEELARRLSHDDGSPARQALDQKYPTGGLAELHYAGARWSDLGDDSCSLNAFVTPRHLQNTATR